MLLKAVEGEKMEALYVLAVTTGMRVGELLGLRWKDMDLQAGTLQVKRTVFNGHIEAPKTLKGRRSIKLTQTSIRALQKHQKVGEWVFCTKVGTPLSVHNLHNRSWKPLLKKTGLPLNKRVSRSQAHLCHASSVKRCTSQDRPGDVGALLDNYDPRYLFSRPAEHAREGGRGYGGYLRGPQVTKICLPGRVLPYSTRTTYQEK